MAVLATSIFAFASSTYAQTRGSERPDDRRDTRSDARDTKQDCKAGDENSRAECRQEKRDVKQNGGQTQLPQNPPSQIRRPASNGCTRDIPFHIDPKCSFHTICERPGRSGAQHEALAIP